MRHFTSKIRHDRLLSTIKMSSSAWTTLMISRLLIRPFSNWKRMFRWTKQKRNTWDTRFKVRCNQETVSQSTPSSAMTVLKLWPWLRILSIWCLILTSWKSVFCICQVTTSRSKVISLWKRLSRWADKLNMWNLARRMNSYGNVKGCFLHTSCCALTLKCKRRLRSASWKWWSHTTCKSN